MNGPVLSRMTRYVLPLFIGLSVLWGCAEKNKDTGRSTTQTSFFDSGRQYYYDLKMTNISQVTSQKEAVFEMASTVVLVPRTTKDILEFLVRFENVTMRSDDEAKAQAIGTMTRELKRGPFAFAYENGRSTYLRLPKGLTPFSMGVVRTVAAALQVSPGDNQANKWTAQEFDGTGMYDVIYEKRDTNTLSKRKTAYRAGDVSGKSPLGLNLKMAVKVASSDGQVVLKDDRLSIVNFEEVLISDVGTAVISSKTTFRMSLKEDRAVDALPAWDGALASTQKVSASKPYIEQNRRDMAGALDSAKIGNHTYDQVFAFLEQDVASEKGTDAPDTPGEIEGKTQARNRMLLTMSSILRTQPENVARAKSAIEDDHPIAKYLIDCLGNAGDDHSQSALIDIIRSEKASKYLRRLSAFKLSRTRHPSQISVNTLTSLMDDSTFGTTAFYGLGTMARALAQEGEMARADAIVATLVERLKKAQDKNSRITALRGIANSANKTAVETVRPFLEDPDDVVRGTAVQALRLMKGEDVDSLIAAALKKESAQRARLEMLSAAKARESSEVLADVLLQVSAKAPDSQSRMQAIKLVVKWMPDSPKVKTLLESMVRNDDNGAIREFATRTLGR